MTVPALIVQPEPIKITPAKTSAKNVHKELTMPTSKWMRWSIVLIVRKVPMRMFWVCSRVHLVPRAGTVTKCRCNLKWRPYWSPQRW